MRTPLAAAAALIAGTAILVGGLSATSSFASAGSFTASGQPWTITPGGDTTATTTVVTLSDPATGGSLSCANGDARTDDADDEWAVGFSSSGNPIYNPHALGPVDEMTYAPCVSPAGAPATLTGNNLPWQLHGTSYLASSGVTKGTVKKVNLTLDGDGCSAIIESASPTTPGTIKFTYTNSTATLNLLTTGGNLEFSDVSGCSGVFNDGDPATISASFTLDPAQTITRA
jgi:hypothetical protein